MEIDERIKAGDFEPKEIVKLIKGKDEQSQQRRKLFLDQFQFEPMLMPSLRLFLNKIHLEGETQQQDFILQAFSDRFYELTQGLVQGVVLQKDQVHQIVYSIVLLNTDLHNANTMVRMSLQQYLVNTMQTVVPQTATDPAPSQPIQNDEPLRQLLEDIYTSVKAQPILQKEQPIKKSFGLFRALSMRTRPSTASLQSQTSVSMNSLADAPDIVQREGLLKRKMVMDTVDKKSSDRRWTDSLCKVKGCDLLVYGTEPEGKLQFHVPLRHATICVLPINSPFSYPAHMFIIQVTTLYGGLVLLEAPNLQDALEWRDVMMYWASMESREPLNQGVGSIWFGFETEWLVDYVKGGRLQYQKMLYPEEVPDESLSEFCKKFEDVTNISVYKQPLLPFVPTSQAKKYEEVTLGTQNNVVSKLYIPNKPLGSDISKVLPAQTKLTMHQKRLQTLGAELAQLALAREMLKVYGIGRGVVDLLAYNGPQDIVALNEALNSPFTGIQPDSAPPMPSPLSPMNASLKAKSMSQASTNTQFTLDVESSNGWTPTVAQYMFATAPGVISINQKGEVMLNAPAQNKSRQLIKLPPPSNIQIDVPQLPQCFMDAIYSQPIFGDGPTSESSIQNFQKLNPKLAQKIDQNWWLKFRFTVQEIVKSYHYSLILEKGLIPLHIATNPQLPPRSMRIKSPSKVSQLRQESS